MSAYDTYDEIVQFSNSVQFYRKPSGKSWPGHDHPPFGMECVTETVSELLTAIKDTNEWLIRSGLENTAHQRKLAEILSSHQ